MNEYIRSNFNIHLENVINVEKRIQEAVTSYKDGVDEIEEFKSIEDIQSYFYEFLAFMRIQANILNLACKDLKKVNGLLNSDMTQKEEENKIINFRY